MTDQSLNAIERMATVKQDRLNARLKQRYNRERRFKAYGIASITAGLAFLAVLLVTIFSQGLPAFQSTFIKLDITYDADALYIDDASDPDQLRFADFDNAVRQAVLKRFPDVSGRNDERALMSLISSAAGYKVRDRLIANPDLLGETETLWVLADDDFDLVMNGIIDRTLPQDERRVSDLELTWIDDLVANGDVDRRFNTTFFSRGDSRDPETAGVWGAVVGSFYTLVVTLALSFPIGKKTKKKEERRR